MGLPLARRLIEVHGGALDIQSVVKEAQIELERAVGEELGK